MLKRKSLVTQLIIIFVVVLTTTVLILMPFVDNNFNRIMDEDNYSILENAQSSYISYNFFPNTLIEDKQIYHFTYDGINNILTPKTSMTNYSARAMLTLFEESLTKLVNSQTKDRIKNNGQYRDKTAYYLITKQDNEQYVISLLYSDYNMSLINSLKQEVIYVFYVALALFGVIMFIWIFTIIKPLKKIQNYTLRVRDNQEATLNIKRKDEIGSLASSLVEMKEELDMQSKIKEEMIHNISHDLKTPIALIKTYTQSIKDDIYPYGDKESSLNVIMENADRLDSKVRSLLYLNRLDYLKTEERGGVTNLKVLIEHIVDQFKMVNAQKEIVVELDDVLFPGKEEQWRICIENIIQNAYRYVDKVIKITLKEDYIEIYNDGEPIDEEVIDKLFKPYQKGIKGEFGLGLSIVAKTVEIYDYKVKAVNQEKGVSFIIYKDEK